METFVCVVATLPFTVLISAVSLEPEMAQTGQEALCYCCTALPSLTFIAKMII
jgi:hypothetical protein